MSSGYSQLKQGTYLIRLNFRVTNVAVCDIIKSDISENDFCRNEKYL